MGYFIWGDMDSRLAIKIVLVLALIASIWYLIGSSQDYSCEKCTITLKSSKSLPISYNMTDLYEESKGGACPVYWDRVWGYRKA